MNRKKELKLWERAKKHIVSGTQTTSKFPNQFIDGVYPIFAISAKGSKILGSDGKEYIDYMAGLGPNILGYCDPVVNAAVRKQLKRGMTLSLPTLLEAELAELINETVPSMELMRFAKNGTDVVTAAVRVSRLYTGREHVAKCGYHGWSDWHCASFWEPGTPRAMREYTHEFKYNDLESLENTLKTYDVAAIVMEPQAIERPKPGYLLGVRELATKYGAVLVFDEVVSGYRLALGGAQEYYGVTPDLTCLGKAIGNGMPISVVGGRRDIMHMMEEHVFFTMTFGGEALSIAGAIATIKQLKTKDYNGHIWRLGDKLLEGIEAAAKEFGVPGVSMPGSAPRNIFVVDPSVPDYRGVKDLFYQEMTKRGVLFPNIIYTNFAHTDEDIDHTVQAARESFEIVAKNMNNIDAALEGKRSMLLFGEVLKKA